MTKPVGEIDETTKRLLRETYYQVRPSPAFKRRLYQQLESRVEVRQQYAGWSGRLRLFLFGMPDTVERGEPQRPVFKLLPNVALLLLFLVTVGSVVLAIRDWSEPQAPAIEVEVTAPPVEEMVTEEPPSMVTDMAEEAVPEEAVTEVPAEETLPVEEPAPAAMETEVEEVMPAEPEEQVVVVPREAEPVHESVAEPPVVVPPPVVQKPPAPTSVPPTPVPAQAVPTEPPPAPPPPPKVLPTVEMPSMPRPPAPTVCTGSRVAGIAWLDLNVNGQRDATDTALAGVRLELHAGGVNGPLVAQATTGADGRYELDNIPSGTYTLKAIPPAGYRALGPQMWGVDVVCAPVQVDFGYQPEG